MSQHQLLNEIYAHYPDADAEWLYEDYRWYCRSFEDDQDAGTIAHDVPMLTFHAWLDGQRPEYLDAHGVKHNL